jgi:hypothetical protein
MGVWASDMGTIVRIVWQEMAGSAAIRHFNGHVLWYSDWERYTNSADHSVFHRILWLSTYYWHWRCLCGPMGTITTR